MWTDLGLLCRKLTDLGLRDYMWTNLRLLGCMWTDPGLLCRKWTDLGLRDYTWTHLGLLGCMWTNLRLLCHKWTDLGPLCHKWTDLGPLCHKWTNVGVLNCKWTDGVLGCLRSGSKDCYSADLGLLLIECGGPKTAIKQMEQQPTLQRGRLGVTRGKPRSLYDYMHGLVTMAVEWCSGHYSCVCICTYLYIYIYCIHIYI